MVDADVREKGLLNNPLVQGALRVMDRLIPGSGGTLALFTYDVYAYLRNPGIRDTIETGVRKVMERDVPTAVVGHSLGAVVSYALLKREGEASGWNVPLYVTVGAPLGITAIKRRLAPIGYPTCARGWFNARDARDVVALYPLDDDHFSTDPTITN